jgi:hypothetical protein
LKKLQIQVDEKLILHKNKFHRSDFGLFKLTRMSNKPTFDN